MQGPERGRSGRSSFSDNNFSEMSCVRFSFPGGDRLKHDHGQRHFSTTESGNSITGRYSCTTTGTDNATITDVATDQTATDTSTTHRQQHLHHHGQRQPHFHIVQQRHQPDRSGDDP